MPSQARLGANRTGPGSRNCCRRSIGFRWLRRSEQPPGRGVLAGVPA
jgi:hypothetical protein